MQNLPNISMFKSLSDLYGYLQKLVNKVYGLTNELQQKTEELEKAKEEIRRLKKLPKKPNLKPSKLDEPIPGKKVKDGNKSKKGQEKRKGSAKEKKQENLEIHSTVPVVAEGIPTGWKFVGYKSRIIQDIVIRANNIDYQIEVWESPDGKEQIEAKLPEYLESTHFGPILKGHILHQYYECCVSQPLIYSSLKDIGIKVSKGTISNILIEDKEKYHAEKLSLLEQAIALKEELRTDDTGARHLAKNGYCNCISSDLFTYFTTSYSKSRINFLEILRMERADYVLNPTALEYLQKEKLPAKYYEVLVASYEQGVCTFKDKASLLAYFKAHNFTAAYAIRTMTQGLLIGCIVEYGFDPQIGIHSDGAGQFNLFVHSLCWKHAERPLVKLICVTEEQQALLEDKKKAFWTLYQDLKAYKITPTIQLAELLTKQFDQMCESVANFDALNQILTNLATKKDQLLLVLARPKTSLHNNSTEGDIREYAKRRKLSAGTRSENGRKARDTFLSLKKTCRKLGISFWEYLLDRLQNKNDIPPLAVLMAQKMAHS